MTCCATVKLSIAQAEGNDRNWTGTRKCHTFSRKVLKQQAASQIRATAVPALFFCVPFYNCRLLFSIAWKIILSLAISSAHQSSTSGFRKFLIQTFVSAGKSSKTSPRKWSCYPVISRGGKAAKLFEWNSLVRLQQFVEKDDDKILRIRLKPCIAVWMSNL